MELIKTKWNDKSRLKDNIIIQQIKDFEDKFLKNFDVNKIEFDDVGFFIVKMYFISFKLIFIKFFVII